MDESMALSVTKLLPEQVNREVTASQYVKIPFEKLATFGMGMDSVVSGLQQLKGGVSGYYKVTIPPGTQLARFKDGSGFLGTAMNHGIVGQARLNQVVIPPSMIFGMVILASIDQKMDMILITQQEMLDFLVQKEKSTLKGDLDFLADILNNYKYNWNDEKFKTANHQKALDIRQHAGQMIDFYREQIHKELKKKTFFHSNGEAMKQLSKVIDFFKDYQLSLYSYAFAYFLEVLLQENFEKKYLDGIAEKMDQLSLEYKELYSETYTQMEKQRQTSIQSKMLGGLSAMNKVAGKAISKIPVISKSPLDETLIEAGEKIGYLEQKRIQTSMQQLIVHQSSCVRPFIDQIQKFSKIYNQSLSIIVNDENLYLEV